MKKILYISFVAILGLLFSQCNKDPQDITEGAKEGGYVTVDKASLNYVVGDGATYSFNMTAHQNSDFDISKIRLYKSAKIYSTTDSTFHFTNEVLSETVDIAGTDPTTVGSKKYAYSDLIEGLTLDGNPLPAADGDLNIGDKFIFRIESELADGSKFLQAYDVKMTVSTRFAGTYDVIAGSYYRLGVLSPDMWVGGSVVIESMDATTYRWTDWGALSGWGGNNLFFKVEEDGTISYPDTWDGAAQTLNGQPLTTCQLNASELSNVNCAESNIVIKDDDNGKDQLIMVHGYLTTSGDSAGPREFDFVLVKQ